MKKTPANSDFWALQKQNKLRFKLLLAILCVIYSGIFYFVFASTIIILGSRHFGFDNLFEIIKSLKFFIYSSAAGLIFTLFQYKFSNKNGADTIVELLKANKPDKEDFLHNQVINILEEIKIASGYIHRVDLVILPTLSKNVFCVDISGFKVIGLTEGIIFKFSRNEIQALISQQFTHLINGDTEIISFICSTHTFFQNIADAILFSGTIKTPRARKSLFSDKGEGESISFNLHTFLIYGVLVAAQVIIKLLNVTISRNREFFADYKAVEYTRNPMALAEALYKISESRISKNIGLHQNLSALFIVPPESFSINEKKGLIAELFSTHPPVKERIDKLIEMAGMSVKYFYFDKGRKDYIKNKKNIESDTYIDGSKNETCKSQVNNVENSSGEGNKDKEEKQMYYVYNQDKWEGPFEKNCLFSLQYLMPDSYVNIAGRDTVGRLTEILPEFGFLENKSSETACPRCGEMGGTLVKIKYEYVPVEKCRRCSGYLVHTNKVIRILNRSIEQISSDKIKIAETYLKSIVTKHKKVFELDSTKLLKCPKCKQNMIRCFYNYIDYIVVDRCLVCNLTWFDAKELEMLKYYV
ncbi:M48 family metalloprotease, partial [Candidatus Dependentiae bacterium]|nr:M48 family metalloprotease [Candidatus Dependentiae bacterium]